MNQGPDKLTVLQADFHRGWGGQIDVVLAACQGLSARGHKVVLALPGTESAAARAREQGVDVFGDVEFRPMGQAHKLFRDALAIRGLIRRLKPDVLHSHGSQDTWALVLANRILPGASRIPHVRTRHNTKRVPYNVVNRYLMRRGIDGLIVVAPEILDRYQRFIQDGSLDPSRVTVIPAPLRPDFLAGGAPDPGKLRRTLDAAPTDLLVGSAVRLHRDKGLDHLLAAAALLAQENVPLRVVLAGDGPAEASLREQAERLGISERVHFVGFRSDVAHVLAGLDIAVLPSVDCDASSGMLKEALVVGTPVVATRLGAASEILGDGRFGALVPPGDAPALARAIADLARDLPAARRAAREGGQVAKERYSVERMINDLESTYRHYIMVRLQTPPRG